MDNLVPTPPVAEALLDRLDSLRDYIGCEAVLVVRKMAEYHNQGLYFPLFEEPLLGMLREHELQTITETDWLWVP